VTTSLYDAVADLPLSIESVSLRRRSRATSSGFERVSTTFRLRGAGELGRGEDVTYDAPDHDALFANPESDPKTPAEGVKFEDELAGEWTFGEFSDALETAELFPNGDPERKTGYPYRRWALESAALDLALRQADTNLAERLDREPAPVTFAASARLGGEDEPPTADRVLELVERVPNIEFKLDPTEEWGDDLADSLPADRIRVLDLKGLYEGTDVDNEADPDFYRWVRDSFPNALIEDPELNDDTREIFDGEEERLSWDYPITGVDAVENLPVEPEWLNVKPSRFGSVESLFATLEWAAERDVSLYSGGQFELGVGREHLHAIASLFYPEGPNDAAPVAFNDPELEGRLPATPLAPSPAPRGFEF